ncbi:MAG: dsDNA nuclease domain-containing protein [Desulfomonilaceae bacterium]
MAMALSDLIVQQGPRETSGSRSSNRFDFQKNWIICLILELHLDDKDYLILCDYHDDVTLFNRELSPSLVSYFQIKTKTGGNWTIDSLLARKKGKNGSLLPSILGKLYSDYLIAPSSTNSLTFVSNACYRFKLNGTSGSLSSNSIKCDELSLQELEKIKQQIANECGEECNLPHSPALFFEVTSLSLNDHAAHTKGKVTDFLDSLFPKRKHSVTTVYRMLLDEVRTKTNQEGVFSSFSELQNKKGIGRSHVGEFLKQVAAEIDMPAVWELVSNKLVQENMPSLAILKIQSEWQKYEVERMDHSNDTLQNLRIRVTSSYSELLAENQDISLTKLIQRVLERVSKEGGESLYSTEYIQAMILMESHVSVL